MTITRRPAPPIGDLLKQWRKHRKLSQLELSIEAGISARHLSFVETGRSAPSREMVLVLAETLGLELRERNQLLVAAGYAPGYQQTSLDAPAMSAVLDMVRQVLAAHEPFPAVVVDRYWNQVAANEPLWLFVAGVAPELLTEPVNVLRLSLHPDGMAPRILNLGQWRAHLLGRLRQQITMTADPELIRLHAELAAYPYPEPQPRPEASPEARPEPEPEPHLPAPGEIAVPLRLRHDGEELSFFSTVATFGTPLDVTVAELVIESFFPADPKTAAALRSIAW